jgi:hypothetical protein
MMPMMNSEARKRAAEADAGDPTSRAALRLAAGWDAEAAHEDACGNGFAAVILQAHAEQLRATLSA